MSEDHLIESFGTNEQNPDLEILKIIDKITDMLKEITEFKDFELKAISFLLTDRFMVPYLKIYIENKKHIKRKHSKEILTALKDLANRQQAQTSSSIFNRKKGGF